MKKFLFMAALCALAFTGCKDDSEPEVQTPVDGDYTGLVLNEICGDDGTSDGHEDWVELYNTSANAIDLNGVQLVKTDEDGVSEVLCTFASGSAITSKGYAVKEKGTDFSAGISNSKNVTITLETPSGQTIDSFDKASSFGDNGSHSKGGSYARIPDGTGVWTVVTAATKGAANAETETPADGDYTGLVLNEVCGDDGTSDGHEDWVELYNTSANAIDLNGVQLVKTDEDGVSEVLCTFASGSAIASKGYAVKEKGTDFSAGISNSKNVTITLETPSGQTIDSFDKASSFGDNGSHSKGGSYARIPDGTGAWTVVTAATKGAANKETESETTTGSGDYTALKLNELNGNDPKYIELYNTGDAALDIAGVQIKKDDEDIVYVAPEGTTLAAHGFLVLLSDQTDYAIGFTGGLSAKKTVKIELLAPDNTSLDVFKNPTADGQESWGAKNPKYSGEDTGMAYARNVDGTGDWYLMKATQGVSNAQTTEVGEKIEW